MRVTVVRSVPFRVFVVAAALLCTEVDGQTVPGEKWKQEITVSMDGMTMPMGRMEICAPVGRTEDLLKPDENCKTSNVKVVGDTTTAQVICTGKDAMTGTVEMTVTGDTVSGKARMKTEDGDEMVLLMRSTKSGPCQAIDGAAVAAEAKAKSEAMAATQPSLDPCAGAAAMIEEDPAKAGPMAQIFVGAGQPCITSSAKRVFCAALETRAGFSSLMSVEAHSGGVAASSATACGLGRGEAGVDALRERMVRQAEAEGDGDFLVAHAPARAREIARSACVVKGEMWVGTTAKWDRFCDSNFAADARGGRAGG